MMGRYKGHVNPQALHALEVAFGVNTHQSLVSAVLHLPRQHRAPGHFGISLDVLPGHGRAPGAAGAAVDARRWSGITTILAFVLGTLIGLVSGWRRGGALDGVAAAALRDHVRVPVLLARAARDLAVRDQARLAPGERRLRRRRRPSAGRGPSSSDVVHHSILPALTILVTSIGGWILTMRNNMITVLAEDYVRMARAKGLSSRGGSCGRTPAATRSCRTWPASRCRSASSSAARSSSSSSSTIPASAGCSSSRSRTRTTRSCRRCS